MFTIVLRQGVRLVREFETLHRSYGEDDRRIVSHGVSGEGMRVYGAQSKLPLLPLAEYEIPSLSSESCLHRVHHEDWQHTMVALGWLTDRELPYKFRQLAYTGILNQSQRIHARPLIRWLDPPTGTTTTAISR